MDNGTGRWERDVREGRGGNELEGLTLVEICVTFLCAQSMTEKWGEERRRACEREGRGCEN